MHHYCQYKLRRNSMGLLLSNPYMLGLGFNYVNHDIPLRIPKEISKWININIRK